MLKWGYGVHTPDFRSTRLTKKSNAKALGVDPIMLYVKRSVIIQIGHIARKPAEARSGQAVVARMGSQ